MIKIFTVDAFTDRPFSGNPAAVCLPHDELNEELMKKIAFEMNLSETAFVTKHSNGFNLSQRTYTMAGKNNFQK